MLDPNAVNTALTLIIQTLAPLISMELSILGNHWQILTRQ